MINLRKVILFLAMTILFVIVFADIAFSQYGAPDITIRGMINREILRQSLPKRRTTRRTVRTAKKPATSKPIAKSNIANGKVSGISMFQMGQLLIPNKYYQNSNVPEAERRRGYEKLKAHWDSYLRVANNDGFPPYDLAYSLEYYLVTNYIIYSDYWDPNKTSRRGGESAQLHQLRISNEITIPIEEKIYWQFKSYLGNHDFLTKLSNEEKQLLAETLVITTGIPLEIYRANLTGDQTQKMQAMKTAETNLQNLLGEPPEKLAFFEEGFTFSQ